MEKHFPYKLDFYYQQTVIYLVTLLLYVGIKGSFVEDRFTIVFKDPVVYVIALFCVIAVVTLVLNLMRKRQLIITENAIIFQSRYRKRIFTFSDIDWIFIGRERLVRTAGKVQLVLLKPKQQPWVFRIRIGRYERSKELMAEMERIAQVVPQRTRAGIRFLNNSDESE